MFRRFNGGKVLPFEYFLALEGLKMVNSMSFCATLCHLDVQTSCCFWLYLIPATLITQVNVSCKLQVNVSCNLSSFQGPLLNKMLLEISANGMFKSHQFQYCSPKPISSLQAERDLPLITFFCFGRFSAVLDGGNTVTRVFYFNKENVAVVAFKKKIAELFSGNTNDM